MDMDTGFYQVPMHPDDREKTGFITPDGLYEMNRMPFGLCNSPSTFQRLADKVLGKLKWAIALVYIDDVIVFSKNFDLHIDHLGLIFEAFLKSNLTLKPSKCIFADHQLEFLGHVISKDGIAMNPNKVNAITEIPSPKNL
jgi:hypothetical protein